ncbi:uncharacterized protein LOC106874396 [Octopus bimaculoides]|uniref:uncharacterized protein LOC106874396 n=1 Tax=Octopus bimaculoides TaxID=37653 RepID=UPI00071C9F0A|nr:uncharacterized protein LOC106874396 [Octopus bimaculoides]|eukprot:XP_014777607.1 PREDICTED: uncharacterized protein LOC106874396 [Octopus bimaculoides]
MTLESTTTITEEPATNYQSKAADTEADNLERKYGTNDDEMFNKILRTHSDAASQVDMSTFSRNGEIYQFTTSHNSSMTNMSQIDIMDYNSYNITTVNLRSCKQKILTPYLRLLKLVGWRPFADDRYYRYWWVEFINLVYPILVLLLLLFIYAWQVGNCWWNLNARIYIKSHEHKHMHTSSSNKSALTMSEDTNLTTINKKGNVECQQNMPTYLITDILHLIMFCMGMVFFRYHGDEQVCGLLEKVFLEIESLRNRNVSNNIMVRKFRIFMGAGITWVLMTVGLQILYFWIYRSHIFITTESLSSATIWSLVVLEVIGVFMINTVSLAAVCNYVIQCEAIILFVRGISLRFLDSGQDLPKGMKQLVEIKCHLKMLNSSTGKMTSLVTFIFAAFTVIGLNTLCMNTADQADIWVYRSLFPLVWGVMLFAPLIQAARVNSACKRFHNDALSFAANGYKALPQAELDSYVLFTSNAKLRAKLFQIPIMAHYLVGVLVFACFLFPILFQTGVLKIKPAKKSWYS